MLKEEEKESMLAGARMPKKEKKKASTSIPIGSQQVGKRIIWQRRI